jgi:hypothetical protein
MTVRPGRNFRVAGFGVPSVWMNIPVLLRSTARQADIWKMGYTPPIFNDNGLSDPPVNSMIDEGCLRA